MRWIEARGRALYAADGTLLRVNGTSMDITERKLAEQALREQRGALPQAVQGDTHANLLLAPAHDDDLVLQDYNDAAEAIGDGRVHEWLGRRASDQFADQPQILADLKACMLERRTIRRNVEYAYHTTGEQRQLMFSFVFVPPATVMVHTEHV